MDNILVSIIIVNYNTSELLKNCIYSIERNTKDITYEIIVSDNGSVDDSVRMLKNTFPNVKVIENNENLGFGAANNRAKEIAKGEFLFFLNSDTLLCNNAVKIFYDYSITHSNIGALGCYLTNSNGDFIHSGGAFPTYRSILNEELRFFVYHIIRGVQFLICKSISTKKNTGQEPKRMHVDYVTGADLFVHNDDSALFDETFFMYYEETDMQKKMALDNKQRILIEGPEIKHLAFDLIKDKKASVSKLSTIYCQISALKYARRYFKHGIFVLKAIVFFDWMNIFVHKKAIPFYKELLKI